MGRFDESQHRKIDSVKSGSYKHGAPAFMPMSIVPATPKKFLTNQGENTLSKRLEKILPLTQEFDCLVGYFYISGFFRLYPALETVKKVRILIGLKNEQVVHGLIRIANEGSGESAPSTAEIKAIFGGMLKKELVQAQDTLAIETGVRKFIDWIRSGKLEVKLYREQNIHAKVYIMTPEHAVSDVNHGYVITGSSNFSHSGLEGNLEFNVLLGEPEDHDYALHRFNELWKQAVDVKDVHETILDIVEKESPFAFFTPHELYLKFLAEYFRDYLGDRSKLNAENLPKNFKKLSYQEDAVFTAQQMLKSFGGVFIADVVGLGKTYISALLALQLDGRCLIIAPPSLLDENSPGSWARVFRDFCIPGHKCVSIGKLEEAIEQGIEFYKYVFIDESHRFKNDSAQRYEHLTRICQGKGVILVSATPYNNTLDDIYSQLKLFQPPRNSTIPGLRNLEAFFDNLRNRLKPFHRFDDADDYVAAIVQNAHELRERVLKHIMVRRTRREIEEFYGDDLKKQKIWFPKVSDPVPLLYQLNPTESAVLEPFFYDTLATDRGHEAWCKPIQCRIPFLNGGLFEPLAGYDWEKTNISFSNSIFSNQERTPAGDTGSGILDVFDRYNFTVNEAEPLEKEVAIDPEMLGKVFENLIEDNRRKGLGSFYTPREIVHYMCQESLINYLDNGLNHPAKPPSGQPIVVPRKDVEEWIRQSDQFAHYAAAIAAGTKGDHYPKPPDSIRKFAAEIDILLRGITVCDPAIGSGAFPVGMMTELVRARVALTPYFKDVSERTPYHFKRHAIQNSIYGVDIDIGAVEIAKLRLWLSLVVDEEDVQQIKPLPNLDYKVVVGNSLLGVERDIFNDSLFVQLEKLKPKFFNESNRDKKTGIKTEIEALIHKLTNGKEVFDFQIYFSEVFHAGGGFDVIVANPPYIDSEAMAKNSKTLRDAVQAKYKFTKGNWDIYIAFFELAFDHLNCSGGVSFITPDKWVAKPFGNEMRRLTTTKLDSILRAGREIFENAKVDAIVTVYFAGGKDSIKVRNFDGRAISDMRIVHKSKLVAPFFYDWMFSDSLSVLSKIEESGVRLDSIGTCENACATSDAYKLQSLVKNAPGDTDFTKYFKIINTGTIGKYVSRWGMREMVYLGARYLRPVVNRAEFLGEFPNSYGKKAGKPKLIAKGLNLLDVCLDEQGAYIPGKTTLIVMAGSIRWLKLLLAIMNHPIAMFYMKQRYPSASYNEGISFTKDMINSYPLPKMSEGDVDELVSMVDRLLEQRSRQKSSDVTEGRIRSRIFELYKLNEADIVKLKPLA